MALSCILSPLLPSSDDFRRDVRGELLQSSYAEMLEILQHYPHMDVLSILHRAARLRSQFSSKPLSFSENLS
jgi:hypothetical protein